VLRLYVQIPHQSKHKAISSVSVIVVWQRSLFAVLETWFRCFIVVEQSPEWHSNVGHNQYAYIHAHSRAASKLTCSRFPTVTDNNGLCYLMWLKKPTF